jgi:hypothetical protein
MSDVSSFVNTDWYCRFRISALSLASACNIPASLSGAIPFVSFLSDLMYDQNLFCFGGLSSWSGSPISMMLLMYFQYDCLSAYLADVIAPPLTLIFQKSLDEGNIPNDWRTANVTAIFKKGERYKASNYRPVSLTSLCCKVQEHIIVSSILVSSFDRIFL